MAAIAASSEGGNLAAGVAQKRLLENTILRYAQDFAAWEYVPVIGLERTDRFERNVFEFIGHDVAARTEFTNRAGVVVRGDDLLVGNLSAWRIRQRLEGDDPVAHTLRFEREHPPELTSPEDADR